MFIGPWYNSAINWPIYLGFERDVFRTVVEYFKQESPLVIEQLQQLFLSVISEFYLLINISSYNEIVVNAEINEEKKTDFLVTGPVEFSSQKSLETLVKEMKVGSPRAERLVATGNLNNKSDFKLTKKEFHVETEFGVDSPVTRLIVPKSELHWQQDHDNKTPIRTPTATGIQTKFGQPKSPLSMYFTKRKDLEISPQGEKTTVVSKLNINVTTDKFVVLNSPIDETHAAMDQLSYSESLERTLDSLPGLVKSPELLSKVDQFKRPMESNKTRATIVGSERPRFFRNLPGSRASIATSNAHRNPVVD